MQFLILPSTLLKRRSLSSIFQTRQQPLVTSIVSSPIQPLILSPHVHLRRCGTALPVHKGRAARGQRCVLRVAIGKRVRRNQGIAANCAREEPQDKHMSRVAPFASHPETTLLDLHWYHRIRRFDQPVRNPPSHGPSLERKKPSSLSTSTAASPRCAAASRIP